MHNHSKKANKNDEKKQQKADEKKQQKLYVQSLAAARKGDPEVGRCKLTPG